MTGQPGSGPKQLSLAELVLSFPSQSYRLTQEILKHLPRVGLSMEEGDLGLISIALFLDAVTARPNFILYGSF